ncbi:hypothetical protein ACP8VM_17700, partial [Klebsiella pneumoniae]
MQKTHFLRFSQGFALHLPGILHQQNTKINIINDPEVSREGANKQVISSQADSLIKISRIWADFFPANTSNQP